MVAGGGASVIYADTVGDLGFAAEVRGFKKRREEKRGFFFFFFRHMDMNWTTNIQTYYEKKKSDDLIFK